MKWIKASERLPEKKGHYLIQYPTLTNQLIRREEVFNPKHQDIVDKWKGCLEYEWLDESQPIPVNQDEKCVCQSCGESYNYDLIIDDSLWEKISPKPVDGWKTGGLLCPKCIFNRVQELNQQQPIPVQEGLRECEHVFDCATCNGSLTCKKCGKIFECG